MMAEYGAATMGTARDLRARVMLALISTTTAKPKGGRAAVLVEEARTVRKFITGKGEGDATSANDAPAPLMQSIEVARMANTAARLMETFQRGAMTLDRLKNGAGKRWWCSTSR